MTRMFEDLSWQADGECAKHPWLSLDDFFFDGIYEKNSPEYAGAKERASRVCSRCCVKQTCLEFAIRNKEEHGFWGGKTRSEREQLANPRKWVDGRYVYIKKLEEGRYGDLFSDSQPDEMKESA